MTAETFLDGVRQFLICGTGAILCFVGVIAKLLWDENRKTNRKGGRDAER